MLKAVTIDDEPFAREMVKNLLADYFPEIEIVNEGEDVESGVKAIRKSKPDIVFLDIELGTGKGFEVLSRTKELRYKLIFVTAHNEYAIRAIKLSAIDFILKPINENEFTDGVRKAVEQLNDLSREKRIDTFFSHISNSSESNKKVVLKTAESIFLVNVLDIVRCESDNNYTTFYMNNGDKILVTKSIKEYEELLNTYGFFRTHQSHLINMNYIYKYDKRDGGELILTDKSHIPVSFRKRQKLLELFKTL